MRLATATRKTVAPLVLALVTTSAVLFEMSSVYAQSTSPVAEASSKSEVLGQLNRRGDLTLRDATLESALFTISNLWGVNIVASSVEGSVNGVFTDAPLREILDSILLSNGYAYRPVGGSLVVSRMQELGQINPFFITETIRVGAAEVGEVVEAARLMSTPQGQIRALPSAGAILVVDFPDRVAKIRNLARQLDIATRRVANPSIDPESNTEVGPRSLEVAYFRLHYITSIKAATALQVILSADGRATAVETEDRLLVVDYPENLRMAQTVLSRLDRPRPQVNIKALIYDISLSDAENIGINWNGITNGVLDTATGAATQQNSGLQFVTQTTSSLDASGTGGAFTFYSLEGDLNLSAVVVALQQAEDSRLLADPNVTVMDNESANIQSVSEIPFQQLTQTTGGGNIGTTAFKEVGIKLDVTPKIARDGTIDLTVVPEFSRLAGFSAADNQPIVDTRRATTRVRVTSGQTMMIAGLRQRSDVGDFDGVPLLKDIRFLGHLFRSRDTQIEESELVVFITPEIVGYGDCLGPRDQITADTIGCRLDAIPAAEGCPQCHGTGNCGCETPIAQGDYEPTTSVPTATVPRTPTPATVESSDRVPTEPEVDITPEVEIVEPLPAYPTEAANPRRLPQIGPTSEPGRSYVRDSAQVAQGTLEKPMRVAYDGRFRATGGTNPAAQRLTERPKAEAAPKKEKRSLGDWLFWR